MMKSSGKKLDKIKRGTMAGTQDRLTRPGGAFTKYRWMAVGNRGLVFLFLYELLNLFLAPFPGVTGERLRRVFYPLIFKGFGKNVRIDKNVVFRNPAAISIGDNVRIASGSSLDVKGNGGTIALASGVRVGGNTILSCPGGDMSIGAGTVIGRDCRLGSCLGLEVGKECTLEDSCYVVGAGHSFEDRNIPVIEQSVTCRGKNVIGDGVLLARGATILDGVTIGNNARIEEGSLVVADVSENAHVAGVPARTIIS